MTQDSSSGSGVKRSNSEAIRRADAEAEKALKRAKELEERRAAKRESATPMDELEEFATNAQVSAESLMIAANAVLTETRKTIEAFTVSALQQAHEMWRSSFWPGGPAPQRKCAGLLSTTSRK